jgi:hypothetical protein
MRDMKIHLEKLQAEAAECSLISDLATDRGKRDLFAKQAKHLMMLASELERAIAERTAGASKSL